MVLIGEDENIKYSPATVDPVKTYYYGKPKFYFKYIDTLEKGSTEYKEIIIQCKDVIQAFKDFSGIYEVVPAGGGVVRNNKGKILMIYRRGFWDLPKGKMDKTENIMQTASREVKEETGLTHIQITKHLTTTYHTYRTGKGKRVLKVSTWFCMETTDQELVPQLEEDIEKAEWVHLQSFLDTQPKIFKNIMDVLIEYINQRKMDNA